MLNIAEGKRYYWLKLYDDFFDSKRIKKLRKLAGGDTYTIIYLKMQLKAIKTDGILKWTGLEDDFASELALDLDEEPDNVAVTLQYLLSCGLAETDSDTLFLPYAVSNTGSETASTQRWREWNERTKNQKVLDSNKTPTQLQHIANVEIDTRDRDRDKIQEIEEVVATPLDLAMEEFKKFRKSIKKPLTDKARELTLTELEKLAPGDTEKKIAILNQSIQRGWQGVFPLKEEKPDDKGRNAPVSNSPEKWAADAKWMSSIADLVK